MRISDWSSDVCSSDLGRPGARRRHLGARAPAGAAQLRRLGAAQGLQPAVQPRLAGVREGGRPGDRKSVVKGTSVSVRVDLGGRRILKKKKTYNNTANGPTDRQTTVTLQTSYNH